MEAHDIETVMRRPPDMELEGRAGAFWVPEKFGDGAMWVGHFQGQSPWERHQTTDELLHILAGEVEITVLTDDETVTTTARAGSLFVVPRGRWHRLLASGDVKLCGVTPGPTDHSDAEDPR
jgi:quercetin dioxygenase-like cupin family protein